MKSISVTLQRTERKETLRDIQLSSLTFLIKASKTTFLEGGTPTLLPVLSIMIRYVEMLHYD